MKTVLRTCSSIAPFFHVALLATAGLALSQAGTLGQETNMAPLPFSRTLALPAVSSAELAGSTNAAAVTASTTSPNRVTVQPPAASGLAASRMAPAGQAQSLSGPSLASGCTLAASPLLNINFGGGSEKTGMAAVGQSGADFWNWCNSGYQDPFFLDGLLWSDGSGSGAALEVDNGPGLWGSGSQDPMYDSFIYPWSGGDISVRIQSFPAGTYDMYVYGHDGSETGNSVCELWVNGLSYGQKGTTIWGPGGNTTTWEEGQQYVVYRNVTVATGDTVLLDVQPGGKGYALVNGMQIVPSSAVSHDPPPTYQLINVDFGGDPQKTGAAAVGQGPSDIWNWYDSSFYGQPSGALTGLVQADGTATGAGLLLTNAPGFWGMDAGDAMYNTFIYPWNLGHVGVTLTNLPAEGLTADFYLYGHAYNPNENTMFQLTTGGSTYGPRGTTIWGSSWATADWEEGAQYVVFRNIPISTNQPVFIDLAPGESGYPKVNGLQIAIPLDRDGDQLPDWWEIKYFGNLDQGPDNDYDGDGVSNLTEYLQGTDPNKIAFSVSYPNDHLTYTTVPATIKCASINNIYISTSACYQ